MCKEQQLQAICTEWKRLAEAEGDAIRSGNWAFLSDCQAAISRLPARLDPLLVHARTVWDRENQQALNEVLRHLKEAQSRNVALLTERRSRLHLQKQTLESRRRTLQVLRKYHSTAAQR